MRSRILRRLAVSTAAVLGAGLLLSNAALAGDGAAASSRGTLSKDQIRAVVNEHRGEIARCYEAVLGATPDAEGKVVVSFRIAGDGGVDSAVILGATLDDDAMHACMMDTAMTWTFPRPEGGGEVVVNYPFIFTPDA